MRTPMPMCVHAHARRGPVEVRPLLCGRRGASKGHRRRSFLTADFPSARVPRLSKLKELYPECFQDVMMPDVDGIELLRYLRGNEVFAAVPVVSASRATAASPQSAPVPPFTGSQLLPNSHKRVRSQ